jgi:DNA-binding MarR family transcriptional regulator
MPRPKATRPPGPGGAPDPSFDPHDYFFYLLIQVAQRRDAAMADALKDHGVTVAKWRTLNIIFRREGCTMGELARFSAIDRTTLTRTVDQLCDDGHVLRSDDPTDRRRVVLTLQPSGLALRNAGSAISRAVARAQLAIIPEADRDRAVETLKTLLSTMTTDPQAGRELVDIRRLEADDLT